MPDYDADAERVFDRLQAGGIAIVHMDVAYAIMSGTEEPCVAFMRQNSEALSAKRRCRQSQNAFRNSDCR